MAQSEKAIPTVDVYESDFGIIRAPGLVACLQNHLKTKVWKWVSNPCDRGRHKECVCSVYCPACKIEKALNEFAQKVFQTGGMLNAIDVTPPLPGTPPRNPGRRLKHSSADEPPGW
jgi:hypothetical protein